MEVKWQLSRENLAEKKNWIRSKIVCKVLEKDYKKRRNLIC